jgi:hypothetical protein
VTDSGNWHTATNLLELQRPIELDMPHILALAAETGFLLFKEQFPLKFKIEISAVQCKRKTFQLISLSTPVSFSWAVLLKKVILKKSVIAGLHCFLVNGKNNKS